MLIVDDDYIGHRHTQKLQARLAQLDRLIAERTALLNERANLRSDPSAGRLRRRAGVGPRSTLAWNNRGYLHMRRFSMRRAAETGIIASMA